jgi:hypothetical protein
VEFESFCTELGRRLGALRQAIIVGTDEYDGRPCISDRTHDG